MSIEAPSRPAQAEAVETGRQREADFLQETIGDVVENITEWQVPASYESAQEKVSGLRDLKNIIDDKLTTDPDLAAQIDKDILADLNAVTAKGLDNWTFDKDIQKDWASVLNARRAMKLTDGMRNRMQRFAAHNGLVGEAEQLLGFKKHAKARLDLNVEIKRRRHAEKQSEKAQAKDASSTQKAESHDIAVPHSQTDTDHAPAQQNHSRKTRRAVREVTTIGHARRTEADDSAATIPEVSETSVVEVSATSAEPNRVERPAYVDPDAWDTYDDTQKRIASDPRSDAARHAASIVRPTEVSPEAWEDRPLYEQVRIADYYSGYNAKAPRSDAKTRYFGFWNEEQEAAIEYLKRPLPKPRHNMATRRGRREYAIENRTSMTEQVGRVSRYLGQEALKAVMQASDTGEALLAKAAPVAEKTLKTSLRAAIGATKKGLELDERMLQRNMEIERGIGRLVLAASEKMKLKQRGKHTGAYVADRLKQLDEWLDEE